MQWEIGYETQVKVRIHEGQFGVEGVQQKPQEKWTHVRVWSSVCASLFKHFVPGIFLYIPLVWYSWISHCSGSAYRLLKQSLASCNEPSRWFLKCWKPYALRSSLSQVTGRWKPYNMFCIFNYVITAEMALLVKQISQQQIQGAFGFFAIYFKVIVEFSLRLLWKREQ